MPTSSPDKGLARLSEGNARFAAGEPMHPHSDSERRLLSATAGQAGRVLATVLACSDSREPVEQIFDAGIADLFVVRIAGNVCTPGVAASVEYGMTHVGTPLLVVLGHTDCGAVAAAAATLDSGKEPSPVMRPVIERVMTSVRGAVDRDAAVEANVRRTLDELMDACPGTRALVESGQARAVGGVHELRTGVVRWLDD